MLLIPCPFCGPRDHSEFSYGGEGHIQRPHPPEAVDDHAWADYLFMRKNPKGIHYEMWMHLYGCRRWFNVARNTVTNQILAVYLVGESVPILKEES